MKRDKQQSTFVNIGSSSLLIIFLVLCLTTFAILSLSSAQSDYSFSQKFAEHKTEYYEASSRAEMILGEIDQILEKAAKKEYKNKNSAHPPYITALIKLLDGKEIDGIPISCTGTGEKTVISYLVPSGTKQVLKVTLLVTNDVKDDNYYKIQTWQLIATNDWNEDNPLRLMPVEQ